jgi:hypothetical protein
MGSSISISKKGIIEQVYEGDQTYNSIRDSADELTEKIEELKKKNKDIKVLLDQTNIGKTTTGARRASVEALKHMDYEKIALFGGNSYIRHLSNFVIQASGKSKKVKVFVEKKDAKDWLKKKEY